MVDRYLSETFVRWLMVGLAGLLAIAGPRLVSGQATAPATGLAQESYFAVTDVPRIRTQYMGQMIRLQGSVSEYRASWSERAPNIIYLRDGANQIEIVFWTDETGSVDVPSFSQPGTPVFAEGTVEVYRGRLQLNVADLKMLSTQPLAGTAPRPVPAGQAVAPTPAQPTEKIEWRPYSPLAVQDAVVKKGSALVYVRSEEADMSQTVETQYLLHPDAAKAMGSRTIYFVNAADEQGQVYAQQMQVHRVPALVLVGKDGEMRRFVFTRDTTPREVYDFMSGLPR